MPTESHFMKKTSSENLKSTPYPYLKILYHTLIIVAVLYLLFNAWVRNDKIAYVDSAKILNEYKGSVEAKKVYDAKAKVWQANIDTLTGEVKASIRGYEKALASMTPKEQVMAKQLIQVKQKQLQDYQRSIQENAKQEDGKLTQTIVSQINTSLTTYGKKNNFKLILIANQSGTIAYGRDGTDITSAVIEELNNDYQANGK
ncbi:MAG: outer membrane protein [Mucilaginibacter sp.]|nr:outer membrane protein [Mucilaginibacter sp.]